MKTKYELARKFDYGGVYWLGRLLHVNTFWQFIQRYVLSMNSFKRHKNCTRVLRIHPAIYDSSFYICLDFMKPVVRTQSLRGIFPHFAMRNTEAPNSICYSSFRWNRNLSERLLHVGILSEYSFNHSIKTVLLRTTPSSTQFLYSRPHHV